MVIFTLSAQFACGSLRAGVETANAPVQRLAAQRTVRCNRLLDITSTEPTNLCFGFDEFRAMRTFLAARRQRIFFDYFPVRLH